MDLNKSIQEIEKDYWSDLKEYPTSLIERCHKYRKIKIKDLAIHQINTLLRQDIGSVILMPLVLERIKENIDEEDVYDGSSFIESIDFYSPNMFIIGSDIYHMTISFLDQNKELVEMKIGWKRYERLLDRIKN